MAKEGRGPGSSSTSSGALNREAVDLEGRFLNSDDDPLGLELVRGKRETFGRIIHAPKKRKGHILIDTCVAPGILTRVSVSKGMSKDLPGIYSASKRSRWGGLWPYIQKDEHDT